MPLRSTFFVLLTAVTVALASCKQEASSPAGNAAAASGASFTVVVTPPSPGKVNTPVVAAVKLEPKNGYKINLEYPTKLTVQAPGGAVPASQVLAQKDAKRFAAAEAVFAPQTTFSAAGEHRVAATFKFSVCTDKVCEMKTEKLSWTASVK